MKNYVYMLTLCFLTISAQAAKFTLKNASKSTLNGFVTPGNMGFTLTAGKQQEFDSNNVTGFKAGLAEDATTFITYQFPENENKDMKIILNTVPGKGGKKQLRIYFENK